METFIQQEVCSALPQFQMLPLSEIAVTNLHRGTNEVYKVEGTGCTSVIFRKFGCCQVVNRETEHATFLKVASAGLGPACLAVGPGYRIEENLSGRRLEPTEVPELAEVIATQIAKLHRLESGAAMPTSYRFFTEWRALFEQNSLNYYSGLASERRKLLDELTAAIQEEQEKVLALTPWTDGLVFSHNDTSYGNFLRHDSGVHLIDYEYAGLNFPAFDIAMLSNEVTIEYFPYKAECFRINRDREFSKERLNALVETYSAESELSECTVWEQFFKCKALAHYGCFMWALCQYKPGCESWFDLLRFAEARLDCYRRELHRLP